MQARQVLAAALLRQGDEAVGRGDFAAAIAAYDQCLAMHPAAFEALYNKGIAQYHAGRKSDAAVSYERALALEPKLAQAWSALGVLKSEAGEHAAAIEQHTRALALAPNHPEFHNNLGLALDSAHRHAEAIASFDRTVALAPDYAAAWSNRGVALHQLARLDDALASFDRALALDADDAEAWSNRGLALADCGRHAEALAAYEKATTLQPGFANAWANQGATFNALKRHDEALLAFERALAIDPDAAQVRGDWLHTKMLLCDWSGLDAALARITGAIEQKAGVVYPFTLLATPASPVLQKLCAERYVESECPAMAEGSVAPYPGHDRIRLGYFSADFHHHAVMVLMAEPFERHDRERFELTAFSFGPPSADAMRQRVVAAFDRFVDVAARSDAEIAALARSLEIDIAIDLSGFTRNARPGIFARRAAPLQVNHLGYPGTMGTSYIDYIVADAVVIPEAAHTHYAEKVACLPHCYQGNASWRPVEPGAIDRQQAGLPEHGFVFCCFNNSFKITPDVFEIWMRLLRAVPGSVLWLLESNASAAANLHREAVDRGVAAERVVFAQRTSVEAHLSRHRLADLFVDTFHYGAHTTASDALRAGLPLLTRLGDTFASRVAASLLTAVELADMVCADAESYEALALALATDPARLAGVRTRLAANAPAARLFDARRFARDMERVFVAMLDRQRAGLAPEHIDPGP